LFAVLQDGTVAALPAASTSMEQIAAGSEEGLPQYTNGLGQNYPNPFNPQTTIGFSIAQPSRVTLSVFNVRGQLVQTLVDDEMAAGTHTVPFNADRLASGVYFYKLNAGSFTETRRMVLLK
jgi:hypothetical protein